MNDDREVSSFLQDVYDSSPDTAEPSAMLRGRTEAELRKKELIGGRGERRRGVPVAWLGAALVVLAFTGGYALGSWRDAPSTSGAPGLRLGNLAAATEVVQGAGTSYSVALDSLVHRLGAGSATDVARARAVVRSMTAAQSEAIGRLLLPPAVESRPDREPDPAADGRPRVVWF